MILEALSGIAESMDMNLSKLREIVKDREAWHAAVHAVTKSQTQVSYWTTILTKLPRNKQVRWEEKYIWFYWKILEKHLNKGNNMTLNINFSVVYVNTLSTYDTQKQQ